jgi:membrane protein DedA with SNARE-associated domain
MFDSILAAVAEYPYVGFAVVFLLCGVGLPLPEEIGLLAAGYVCATNADRVTLHWMMVWCGGAILAGDLIPYVLGRVFGVRLLRLRWLRYLVTKQRLAKFDRWFRRRGDAVIFIARFLAGLRVVAFFTAGTMKMPWIRFLVLDGLGILVLVPVLTLVGFHSAEFIQRVIEIVQKVERGILWTSVAGGIALGAWVWLWRRRRQRRVDRLPGETFVEPQRPVGRGAGEQGAGAQQGPAEAQRSEPASPENPRPAADQPAATDGAGPSDSGT